MHGWAKKVSGDNEVRHLHSTWLRRQDSKRSPKFSFVLKGAYNLHYLQKTAHLFQMMRIFTIVHFLVREKIRKNFHSRCIITKPYGAIKS